MLRGLGGQPPAWAHQALKMWQDQPRGAFEEWLATVDGGQVSILTRAASAGVWPVMCVPQETALQ